MTDNATLTERLHLFMQGDIIVVDELLDEVLPKLREMTARELKREGQLPPLSKTELIQQVWLNNLLKGGWQVQDRGHFFALASLAMRRILGHLARKKLAVRRGTGEITVSLDEPSALLRPSERDAGKIVEIGVLMERLETEHPDAARVVDMHYFSGFTLEEIAEETGLTLKQVRLLWRKGFNWLKLTLRSIR